MTLPAGHSSKDSAPPRPTRRILIPGLALLTRLTFASPWYFGIAIVGGIIYALLLVFTSTLVGEASERAIIASFEQGNVVVGATWGLAAAILGVAALRAAMLVARRVFTMYGIFDIQVQMRERLLRAFARTPLQWHRNRSTGTLLSAVYADAEAAVQALAPWAFAVSTVVMLAYVVVKVALIDWAILLVMLVMLALLIGLNLAFQVKVTPVVTRIQELRSEVSSIAHESFDGANVVKALGRESDEEARFTRAANDLRDSGIRFGYLRGWFDPLIDALPNIGIILFALLGAWRISDGHLTTGELVEISYLFTLMALPLRSFGWVLGSLSRTVIGAERVEEIAAAEAGDTHRPAPGHTEHLVKTDRSAVLAFENVSLEYDDDVPREDGEPALHAVNLTADPREGSRVLAVVGATGSGKSTLTLLAARLLDPTAGRITVDGHDLQRVDAESLYDSVALVLQQAFVYDDTVRGNVALGADVTDAEVWRALEIAQARAFVEALPDGLDTRLGERGGTLSGGQRQRIALARALVREPRLLILDDATSACDPTVEAAILDGIRTHMTGSTLLVVAYRKSTISIADRVVFMAGGTVEAEGTHAELSRTSPEYAALVNAYDEAAIAHGLLEAENPGRRRSPYNMGTKRDADDAAHTALETGHTPVADALERAECEPGRETGSMPTIDPSNPGGRK